MFTTESIAAVLVGWAVDLGLINGKRERHCFQTKADAETFAEVKRTERTNEGTAALGLSQEFARMPPKPLPF